MSIKEPVHKESRCYKCGARIYWAKTIMGKFVPVDVEEVILNGTGMYGKPYEDNEILFERGEIGDCGYKSHFESCKAVRDISKQRQNEINSKNTD